MPAHVHCCLGHCLHLKDRNEFKICASTARRGSSSSGASGALRKRCPRRAVLLPGNKQRAWVLLHVDKLRQRVLLPGIKVNKLGQWVLLHGENLNKLRPRVFPAGIKKRQRFLLHGEKLSCKVFLATSLEQFLLPITLYCKNFIFIAFLEIIVCILSCI